MASEWKGYAREVPLFGGLVDCDLADHWKALGQTFIVVLISTAPIWLAALVVYGKGNDLGVDSYWHALCATT